MILMTLVLKSTWLGVVLKGFSKLNEFCMEMFWFQSLKNLHQKGQKKT